MAVFIGVLCERCGTVCFISAGKSTHLKYNRSRGEFRVVCGPPCNAVTFFQKDMLKAYAVTGEPPDRGHVSIRECEQLHSQRRPDYATSRWQAEN